MFFKAPFPTIYSSALKVREYAKERAYLKLYAELIKPQKRFVNMLLDGKNKLSRFEQFTFGKIFTSWQNNFIFCQQIINKYKT